MTTMNNEDTADMAKTTEGRYHDFTLAEAMEIAKRNDPGARVPSTSRTFIAEIVRLRKALLYTADQMRAAVDAEREANAHELSAALGWPGGISEPVTDVAQLLRRVAGARRILSKLSAELVAIAETSALPDGDGVNAPTLLWAEEWRRRLAEKEQPK